MREPVRDRFPRLVWGAILVVTAATPLVFSTVTQDVYRLPKSLFFQAATLIIGAAVVVWDALCGGIRERASRHRGTLILASLAVAWTAVVTMTAVNPTVAIHAPLTVLCYAAFLAMALVFARRTPVAALFALIGPAVVNAVILLLQWRDLWKGVSTDLAGADIRHRWIGLMGNPDFAAVYLLVPTTAAVSAAFTFRRVRAAWAAVAALLLLAILIAGSLTAFVALAAIAVSFAVVVPSRRVRMSMALLFVVGIVALAAYSPTRTRAVNIAQWVSEGRYHDATSFRLPAWNVAWQMFTERPLIGVGPGGYAARYMSYKLAGDEIHPEWMTLGNSNFGETHNDYLQLLAEAGLAGFALLAFFLFRVARVSLSDGGPGAEGAFARTFALPAVVGFAVAALAQFPLHLTATCASGAFAAALCLAWGQDV